MTPACSRIPHLPVASPRFQDRSLGPSVPLRASTHIAICRRGRGLHKGLMMRPFLIRASAHIGIYCPVHELNKGIIC